MTVRSRIIITFGTVLCLSINRQSVRAKNLLGAWLIIFEEERAFSLSPCLLVGVGVMCWLVSYSSAIATIAFATI